MNLPPGRIRSIKTKRTGLCCLAHSSLKYHPGSVLPVGVPSSVVSHTQNWASPSWSTLPRLQPPRAWGSGPLLCCILRWLTCSPVPVVLPSLLCALRWLICLQFLWCCTGVPANTGLDLRWMQWPRSQHPNIVGIKDEVT